MEIILTLAAIATAAATIYTAINRYQIMQPLINVKGTRPVRDGWHRVMLEVHPGTLPVTFTKITTNAAAIAQEAGVVATLSGHTEPVLPKDASSTCEVTLNLPASRISVSSVVLNLLVKVDNVDKPVRVSFIKEAKWSSILPKRQVIIKMQAD